MFSGQLQGHSLLMGGVPSSTLLTSSRKQQRSIRDFFISPPAVPSAKRLKAQSHASSSAHDSDAQHSAAHDSNIHRQPICGTAASESAPHNPASHESSASAHNFLGSDSAAKCSASHGTAAEKKSTGAVQLTQQRCTYPDMSLAKQSRLVWNVPASSHSQSRSGQVEAECTHTQQRQPCAEHASVKESSSTALQHGVGMQAVSGHVGSKNLLSCQPAELLGQQLCGDMLYDVHDDKENVCEAALV